MASTLIWGMLVATPLATLYATAVNKHIINATLYMTRLFNIRLVSYLLMKPNYGSQSSYVHTFCLTTMRSIKNIHTCISQYPANLLVIYRDQNTNRKCNNNVRSILNTSRVNIQVCEEKTINKYIYIYIYIYKINITKNVWMSYRWIKYIVDS